MTRPAVKNGDTILVDYTIKLEDGTLVGTTLNNDPVQFTIGNAEIIPGLETAALGMREGETKNIVLAPPDAYGPRLDELIQEIDIKSIPDNQVLTLGQTIELHSDIHDILTATIISISENKVTLDCNHVLAGKRLCVEFKIIEIL